MQKKKAAWLGFSAAMALGIGLPSPAAAQSQPEDDAATSTEIIVTATRREERLRDVPQSVTAVTADDLTRLSATQLRDYANTVPALTVSSAGVGFNQLTIRGVTSGRDTSPTVGVYVDDVPYGSSTPYAQGSQTSFDAGLFDLERVEVLRGPQGTLYGASTMGGVLKYVTRQPDMSAFEGSALAGVSSNDDGGTNYNGAVVLSGPLVEDRVGARASGYFSHDAGFIDDVALGEENVDSSDVGGARLDVLFTPSADLSIRLVGFAQNIDRDGNSNADYTLAGESVDGDLDQRRRVREPFAQDFRLFSGTVEYDFNAATLTSVSSYQTVDTSFRIDLSQLYVPYLALVLGTNYGAVAADFSATTDKFTQEIRLASAPGTIEWLVGGFYTNEDSANGQQVVPYDLVGGVSPDNLLTLSIPSTYEEMAVFGNVTVHLSDSFDVTAGLRYAENDQEFTQIASGLLAGSFPTATSSEQVTTYLVNARYRFNERSMAYARFATGYRPGGPNAVLFDPISGDPLAPPTFESDALDSYEVGYRGETPDRSFEVDVAAYHIDWDNIQINAVRGGLGVIDNAGAAEVDGAELTLTARPTDTLTVSAAFAHQDARLSEDAPDLGGAEGEALPNVPDFTAAFSADYQAREGSFRPSVGATLRFVADRSSGFEGTVHYDLESYATVDLRAGATFGPVDAQLFVRNVTDERGQISASTVLSALGGPAQVTIMQPRTIGVTLRTAF